MQTKKGKQWHFGMKVHIGVDSASGLVHSASVTAVNVHDSQRLDKLLLGHETRLVRQAPAKRSIWGAKQGLISS